MVKVNAFYGAVRSHDNRVIGSAVPSYHRDINSAVTPGLPQLEPNQMNDGLTIQVSHVRWIHRIWTLVRFLLLYGSLPLAITVLARADEKDGAGNEFEFFENRIRPMLIQHCYQCHSDQAKSLKGGLRLDSREAIRDGGDSGHAIVPHIPDASLMLSALRYEEFEMPPSGQLDENIIDDFETWIQMGAPDPRDQPQVAVSTTIDLDKGRDFWAFKSPTPPSIPDVDRWVYNDVDRFLARAHKRQGVVPVKNADRATLLRRVFFDLTGLPPSPDDIMSFVNDRSPDAFANVVDQLLESPHYGERWGRHWLDIVRFAESTGRTRNFPYPFAWRYRHYVIQSLNQDKPYDQFIREQLAGDLLPAETEQQRADQQIATAFLAMGAYDLNERNNRVFRMDIVGDQIDVTSRAIMGITVGCARCHDHKFDPFPTHDYYAMAGIFRSTDVLNGYTNRRRNNQFGDPRLLVRLENSVEENAPPVTDQFDRQPDLVTKQDLRRARGRVERLKQVLERKKQQDTPGIALKRFRERLADAQTVLGKLQKRYQRERKRRRPKPFNGPYAMGVQESLRISNQKIHVGGDVDRQGPTVPRGFLQVVHVANTPLLSDRQSGRLELADWLTQPDHPLTSRVIVNRVWHHLFGQGIVRTVDNFGQMGARPTHPELLDHLAVRFVEEGWSIKSLVRSIVLSHAYQLSNDHHANNMEIDSGNQFVWRVPMRRLEAEAIRDAILVVSGELDATPPGQSPVQDLPIAPIGRRARRNRQLSQEYNYRSVYLPIIRSRIPDSLATFDFPEPSDVKGDRDVTTVATQALFMMNSTMIQTQSQRAAERLLSQRRPPRALVTEAYLLTIGRPPNEQQIQRVLQYARESRAQGEDRIARE